MNEKDKTAIEEQLQSLPKGTITVKRINGREYEYWQYREEGKQITKRVKGEELKTLRIQIEERKRLEKLLKEEAVQGSGAKAQAARGSDPYEGLVRVGTDLVRFAQPVSPLKKREIFGALREYIYGPDNDRVFILYGLRRTGKTTMIRQMILEMPPGMREKAAFIQVRPKESLASLSRCLKQLEDQGFRYIFIDEDRKSVV